MKDQYQHYLELLKGLRLMDDDSFQKHWMKNRACGIYPAHDS